MQQQKKPENAWANLLINIVLPVFILNKLSTSWDPLYALILALSLPIAYGMFSTQREGTINWFSVLGVINISATGALALLGLGGIWFAVKEAFFPFIIGIFVFASAFTAKPFIQTLMFQPHVFHLDRLEEKLLESKAAFQRHLRFCTQLLSISFFVSALLNFLLAQHIFVPLNESLSESEKAIELNSQIAQMTSWSFAVILAPSMIMLVLIVWYLFRGIHQLTGLKAQDLLKS